MATSNMNEQKYLGDLEDPAEDEEELGTSMSLIDHLEELRWRIFKCLIAIAVFTIVAFIFRVQIMNFLQSPLPQQAEAFGKPGPDGLPKLVVSGIAEGFTVFLMVSIAAGTILSIPVLLYQVWAFVSPGLYAHEKKHAVPFIFIGIILFLMGIGLGYIVLRYPLEWLVNFASSNFTELITANSYFTFVAFFILAFGVVFELPLVLTFLAKIGIISGEMLRQKRAMAHVVMWIAATFLTPGADLYSPIFLGVAMSFLYELTIIFIRFAVKPDKEAIA
ncbi:MAG TPA: twin-arginine translocase subunit TatC [Ktedonosporobacter sp.]|nr:twin-arginine translocase subunit TatC [Ktedonosporobacter sp.]